MKTVDNLPSPLGLTRQEILDLLLREEYGYIPSKPYSVSAEVVKSNNVFFGGKATFLTLNLNCKADWGEFTFPVYYVRPNRVKQTVPAFIHINFRNLIPDALQPTEEIIDAGYAVLTFCHSEVSSDDGDFSTGISKVWYPDEKRNDRQCGKIGMWAWAACACMDYALTLPELNHERISVIGHSRLGKTALLAGALDQRFYCAISNDSGCNGAALSREKVGERLRDSFRLVPFWYCENYRKYVDKEDTLPFDQHFLLACNSAHRVYVASSVEDEWADPKNEYLSCVEASDYFEKTAGCGFVHPDRLPEVGEYFHEGKIGYHLRAGTHSLTRDDWQMFVKYLNANKD